MEELDARINQFEANMEAGKWLTVEEANRKVGEALPWLRKPRVMKYLFIRAQTESFVLKNQTQSLPLVKEVLQKKRSVECNDL